MNLLHITMYHYPVNGGQQVYIEQLNKLLQNRFERIETIQLEVSKIFDYPSGVTSLKRFPKIFRIFRDSSWVAFLIGLYRKKEYIKSFDIVIVHYSFFYNAIPNKSKAIFVSHGVEWDGYLNPINYFRYWMARKVLLSSNYVVANDTNFLKILDRSELGKNDTSNKNKFYIPNSVDIQRYSKYGESITFNQEYILVPRNIRKDRGITLAISILHELKNRGIRLKLIVAGGPLKGLYYFKCKMLIEKYKLNEDVVFLGSISQEMLIKYYRGSKLTLIPTLAMEGTSLSALEAMSCGSPTFSTNVGGLLDLPTEKISTVAQDAAESISRKWLDLDRISEIQRLKVSKHFNNNKWNQTWLNVINQKMETRGDG